MNAETETAIQNLSKAFVVNIPSSWPIIRAKTPRREREILGTSHRLRILAPSRRPISPELIPRRQAHSTTSTF